MLERMRTRHTEVAAGTLRVVCPIVRLPEVKQYLLERGCRVLDADESVEPREVFPDRSPSTLLRGARTRESLTQRQLAEMADIPRRHISEMENGRRTIGKHNASKLGNALNVDPRLFL